jgi:hypothetical protein
MLLPMPFRWPSLVHEQISTHWLLYSVIYSTYSKIFQKVEFGYMRLYLKSTRTFLTHVAILSLIQIQARTGRGIHGLPKVSPGPAMPNPYTPCGRTTPETALRPFRGWPAHRAGGLRPSSSPLDTPSRIWAYSDHSGLLQFIQDDFHDQGDAKWIVIRGHQKGHKDTPFGRPTPAGPSDTWGSATLQAYLVVLITIN